MTPGSVNVRDCVKDGDAQIAFLDLILILDDSTGNYQEMMYLSLPITIESILPYPFDLEAGIPLFDPPLVSLIGLVEQNILKTFPQVLEFHKPVVTH